jgi:TRAP-type C4-dicarboxylate transport system substrate-binding protein
MWEFYLAHAQKEFDAYKVLAIHSGSGVVMNTARKAIANQADLKGIKLRSPSRMASRLLAALGGTPVNMPPPQITEAVAKGVVDGALAPWEVVPAVKLDEVTKFHSEPPANEPGFTANALALLMNKQKYESLPPALKEVLDRNSGAALVQRAGASWDRANEAARKKAEAAGSAVSKIAPAEYQAMRQAAAGVEQEWIKEVAGKGMDGAALTGAVRTISAKYLRK